MRKIRQRIFLRFYLKDPLTTGKNFWKAANSTSKSSTSSPLQVVMMITDNNTTQHHFDHPWRLTMSLRHFTNGPLS